MKIKVSEATGVQLDWMVAKCEGFDSFEFWHTGAITPRYENGITRTHSFSTSWSQGGPIIEREKISPSWSIEGHWAAYKFDPNDELEASFMQFGPTPLIAAMRCYVASKLGDEVEVPEELK